MLNLKFSVAAFGRSKTHSALSEAFEDITGVELALYSLAPCLRYRYRSCSRLRGMRQRPIALVQQRWRPARRANRTAAGTALQFDEVDFVFAGPSEFVLFQQLAEMDILFSVVRPDYGSSFVVKADSGIMEMADLAGKRVALKDAGSTSGHIFPMMMMVEAGLDVDNDVEIIMAADARIQVLINGDVDAMGGGNKDYDAVLAQDSDTEYRLLAQTDVLPGDPVVMRATLPQDCRDALRATLAEHHDALWAALTETERNADKFIERGAYMSFETDPAIYDMVRDAYAVAGIPLDD